MLGLTDDETNAYRELVCRTSCGSAELADALRVPVGRAAQLLDRLEQLGLASRNGKSPGSLSAAPPQVALGALLMQQQNELKLAQVEMSALEDLYRINVAERTAAEIIDVVQGTDAIRQRFDQLQKGARSEVLCFVQGPLETVRIGENAAEPVVSARGVSYRVIWERQILDGGPEMFHALDHAALLGEEVRIAEAVPLKMLAIDREMALIPVTGPTAAEEALLVRPSALLDALLALFDLVWQRAAPVSFSTPGLAPLFAAGVVDEVDGRILGLLCAGLTDQAVASRLDLSLRTVQRRVRGLMEHMGARTRLQLGLQTGRLELHGGSRR